MMRPLLFSLALTGLAVACTVGVFAPSATVCGRPLLWKNRDVDNDNQEAAWRRGSRYTYVTNVYGSGDTLGAWGGINEVGFAIMNSNSYNLSGLRDADDGAIMAEALGSCATIEDFARILDSTGIIGRTQPANFGVFDATGRAVFFEAANTFDTMFEANTDSLGFLLRANYSMSGDTIRLRGRNRYERAMQLVLPARQANRIDVPFLVQTLSRDMGQTDFDPYPLPFRDSLPGYRFGYIPADSTICRRTTRSVEIMVGPEPGGPASRGMMWILLGAPEAALPIPLWVQGGPVPEAMNGPLRSQICDAAIRVRDFIRSDPQRPTAVNTFRLHLIRSKLAPVESTLLRMVADSEAVWPYGPSADQARRLTATACELVLQAYIDLWDTLSRYEWGDSSFRAARQTPPPPVIGRNLVQLTLPGADWQGSVRVADAFGRTVAVFPACQAGSTINWETASISTGNYFFIFPTKARVPTHRITIVR